MKQQKLFLILLLLQTGSVSAQDNGDNNVAAPNGTEQPAPAPEAQQPPPQNDQTNQDPAANPGETAADRFRALREKRLEEAREYQRQQEARDQARAEKLRLEEEARLEAERLKYANEKDSFLSQFKKKDVPTPTPTPSVLDELDQLVGEDEDGSEDQVGEQPAEDLDSTEESQ